MEGFGVFICFFVLSHPWSLLYPQLVREIFIIIIIGDSSAGSLASLALVTPPLVCREGPVVALLVTSPLGCGRSLASGLLIGVNSSGLWGELASAFAVGDSCLSESELDGDYSSLRGRGIDMLWGVLS